MRALLLTVMVVIATASAGIGLLAILPAPDRPSDSLTLVIETGAPETTRTAASGDDEDIRTGALADRDASQPPDTAQTDGNARSLDDVIAARLRAGESQTESSDTPDSARSGDSGSSPAPTRTASGDATATADTDTSASSDSFAQSDDAAAPPGSVSITEMLAAELSGDDSASESEDVSGPSDTETADSGPAPDSATPVSGDTTDTARTTDNASGESETGPAAAASGETSAPSDRPAETEVAALDPSAPDDVAALSAGPDQPTGETGSGPVAETQGADRPARPAEQGVRQDAPALPRKRGAYKLRGKIALIIRGLGVKADVTASTLETMPRQVAMGFVPYGKDLKPWTDEARQRRHEVLIQIPMEPKDYPENNPGPHTLLTSLSIDKNLQRLDWLLNRFSNIMGVTNFLGGKFAEAPTALAPIMMELKARNLVYIGDGTVAQPATLQIAGQLSLSFSAADSVIDSDRKPDAISKALTRLEEKARANGSAIAIAHAYPGTLKQLEKWIPTLQAKGLALVPVSELVSSPPQRISQSTGG